MEPKIRGGERNDEVWEEEETSVLDLEANKGKDEECFGVRNKYEDKGVKHDLA